MGDLFDGYGSTLAPRKTPSGVPAYDEMFGGPAHPGAPAESREAYRELYQALAKMTQALGGSFTVFVDGNLFRIAGDDAEAIGKSKPAPLELPEGAGDAEVEKLVLFDWGQVAKQRPQWTEKWNREMR